MDVSRMRDPTGPETTRDGCGDCFHTIPFVSQTQDPVGSLMSLRHSPIPSVPEVEPPQRTEGPRERSEGLRD